MSFSFPFLFLDEMLDMRIERWGLLVGRCLETITAKSFIVFGTSVEVFIWEVLISRMLLCITDSIQSYLVFDVDYANFLVVFSILAVFATFVTT